MIEYSLLLSLFCLTAFPAVSVLGAKSSDSFSELGTAFLQSVEIEPSLETETETETEVPPVSNWHQVDMDGPFSVPVEARGLGRYGILIVDEYGLPTGIIHYKENESNPGEWSFDGYDRMWRYYSRTNHPLGASGEGPEEGAIDGGGNTFWYIPPTN